MLKEYAESFREKTVSFIGLGVSNLPIAELLASAGVRCTVRANKAPEDQASLALLQEHGVSFHFGEGYLADLDEDVLFLAPAVRPDLPELCAAAERGAVLTSEMQEFFRLCPCKRIGVTGSDGKTTTTTLVAKLLEAAGHRVHLGGNIGKNLLAQLDDIRPEDYAVVELSSFQLFKMTLSPEIALITNLAPNHLDWHKDMEEYADAKANIFAHQGEDGLLILNRDDPYAERYAAQAKGSIRWISGQEKLPDGVWFDDEGIHRGDELLLREKDILLVGRHNRYNYAQALAALGNLVPVEAARKATSAVARTFGGVEHRIEFLREKGGVKFYNSSIDSSPSRTAACLNSFAQKVIVICGGYDKKIPLELLGPLFLEKAKAAVLCGATAEKIEKVLQSVGYKNYVRETDFEKAVHTAVQMAEPGDCVVLSPAAASFDLFKNFAERGETFRRLIMNL
ncbi:MAG: UDP-N-acetylmuramoyl-L-alanine--D-glutamate ligase [Oscillospiraceae bacterium]|nr:UDP-N-acetylmuramoyl-L-alanine--D-glutamate ligase [Oscillospiraceae bacterium]